jgi:transcriptional regulator with XRE-family HTH domain
LVPTPHDRLIDELGAALGPRLKKAREGKGWPVQKLADEAGVTRQMIYNIEGGRGGNIGIATIKRLADALGLPAGWLAFGG